MKQPSGTAIPKGFFNWILCRSQSDIEAIASP